MKGSLGDEEARRASIANELVPSHPHLLKSDEMNT